MLKWRVLTLVLTRIEFSLNLCKMSKMSVLRYSPRKKVMENLWTLTLNTITLKM